MSIYPLCDHTAPSLWAASYLWWPPHIHIALRIRSGLPRIYSPTATRNELLLMSVPQINSEGIPGHPTLNWGGSPCVPMAIFVGFGILHQKVMLSNPTRSFSLQFGHAMCTTGERRAGSEDLGSVPVMRWGRVWMVGRASRWARHAQAAIGGRLACLARRRGRHA